MLIPISGATMRDSQNTGFGKFVPGFDFLQNLAKGASETIPQMPNLANWIAPTLNVEDLDRRIEELKAVQFWLDQNAMALKATIQALEVQKMTLATLKGMNLNMGEMVNAFQTGTAGPAPSAASHTAKPAAKKAKSVSAAPGMIDPMQLWGALSQQFQQIAADAMKDGVKPGAGKPKAPARKAGKTGGTRSR
jgi:hypothetical protein